MDKSQQMGCSYFHYTKEDGRVRFISDFRKLNEWLRRAPYPIPKIQDLLTQAFEGFMYATSLYLNISSQKTNSLEHLGYWWVTHKGIQPMPKTRKQLRGFIGMINYYRDMWKHRSHVLAPLTSLTCTNIPWKWGEE
jgi:hypothetical protein